MIPGDKTANNQIHQDNEVPEPSSGHAHVSVREGRAATGRAAFARLSTALKSGF
jgi:hypothetical protein